MIFVKISAHMESVELSSDTDMDADVCPDVLDGQADRCLKRLDLRAAGADGLFGTRMTTCTTCGLTGVQRWDDDQLADHGRTAAARGPISVEGHTCA